MLEKRAPRLFDAKVIRVVDGDTVDVEIDLGFEITRKERLRLWGINTPEVRGDEKEAGLEAALVVRSWIAKKWVVIDTSRGYGKYGRCLATIWVEGESSGEMVNVNQWLVDNDYAVEYLR